MANVKPFRAMRPNTDIVSRVAALPYDVYNRAEAKTEVQKEPLSFLRIDRPETNFGPDFDMYSDEAYKTAHDLLWEAFEDGTYVEEKKDVYYIYELIMDGRHQTGIVAVASVDDYVNEVIKKHENTRAEKEKDRIRHIDTCDAQTGPIFLAYRDDASINEIVNRVKLGEKLYGFTAEDGITHNVWVISNEADVVAVKKAFGGISSIYIADGHHRAASAVKVGLKRRAENPNFTGQEEFNFFLSVLFPESELAILPYNRVVKDLNGLTEEAFLSQIAQACDLEEVNVAYQPDEKGVFGMYLSGKWYKLSIHEDLKTNDPVEGLDVSLLQNYILQPVLGIDDPRTDARIDFVGGIRGLGELERRCATDSVVAFSMYPTSIDELFSVADAGRLMPPKSTWFEPKLRSGIFIHKLS